MGLFGDDRYKITRHLAGWVIIDTAQNGRTVDGPYWRYELARRALENANRSGTFNSGTRYGR